MTPKILHLNIMDLQIQLQVGRSAGRGRGHGGICWVVEMVPSDELWRERGETSEGSEPEPPGHGTWSHQGGFHPKEMNPCSAGLRRPAGFAVSQPPS